MSLLLGWMMSKHMRMHLRVCTLILLLSSFLLSTDVYIRPYLLTSYKHSEFEASMRAVAGCIFSLDHLCDIFPSLQTLKNALSPYKLGGASGGSDFDPKGKSDNEVNFQFI